MLEKIIITMFVLPLFVFGTRTNAEEKKPLPTQEVTDSSPKEALRKIIFPDSLSSMSCRTFVYQPKEGFSKYDKEFDEFLRSFIQGFKGEDAVGLVPFFHPRTKTSLNDVKEILASFTITYKKPWDISVYRIWAINTVDGSTKWIPCLDKQEGISVYPLYGYPLQFSVWLQIMGQIELGKINLIVVPTRTGWKIGSFHGQQWTHLGKDYVEWSKDGLFDLNKSYKLAAYIKLDMARKLADAGNFLKLSDYDELAQMRDKVISSQDFAKEIRQLLSGKEIVFLNTLLAKDGAGLLLRIKITPDVSGKSLNDTCLQIGRRLKTEPWFSRLGGIKCSYVTEGENPEQEGRFGGIYMSSSEF